MSDRDWKREYEQALRPHGAGQVPDRAAPESGGDQRHHPRLQPRGVTVWLGVAAGLHLISLDEGAVEFYADRPFESGARISIQVDTAPPFEGEVVSCVLEESDAIFLEVRYRVRCRVAPDAPRS